MTMKPISCITDAKADLGTHEMPGALLRAFCGMTGADKKVLTSSSGGRSTTRDANTGMLPLEALFPFDDDGGPLPCSWT